MTRWERQIKNELRKLLDTTSKMTARSFLLLRRSTQTKLLGAVALQTASELEEVVSKLRQLAKDLGFQDQEKR